MSLYSNIEKDISTFLHSHSGMFDSILKKLTDRMTLLENRIQNVHLQLVQHQEEVVANLAKPVPVAHPPVVQSPVPIILKDEEMEKTINLMANQLNFMYELFFLPSVSVASILDKQQPSTTTSLELVQRNQILVQSLLQLQQQQQQHSEEEPSTNNSEESPVIVKPSEEVVHKSLFLQLQALSQHDFEKEKHENDQKLLELRDLLIQKLEEATNEHQCKLHTAIEPLQDQIMQNTNDIKQLEAKLISNVSDLTATSKNEFDSLSQKMGANTTLIRTEMHELELRVLQSAQDQLVHGVNAKELDKFKQELLDLRTSLKQMEHLSPALEQIVKEVSKILDLLGDISITMSTNSSSFLEERSGGFSMMHLLKELLEKLDELMTGSIEEKQKEFITKMLKQMEQSSSNLLETIELKHEKMDQLLTQYTNQMDIFEKELDQYKEKEKKLEQQIANCPSQQDTLHLFHTFKEQMLNNWNHSTSEMLSTLSQVQNKVISLPSADAINRLSESLKSKLDREEFAKLRSTQVAPPVGGGTNGAAIKTAFRCLSCDQPISYQTTTVNPPEHEHCITNALPPSQQHNRSNDDNDEEEEVGEPSSSRYTNINDQRRSKKKQDGTNTVRFINLDDSRNHSAPLPVNTARDSPKRRPPSGSSILFESIKNNTETFQRPKTAFVSSGSPTRSGALPSPSITGEGLNSSRGPVASTVSICPFAGTGSVESSSSGTTKSKSGPNTSRK